MPIKVLMLGLLWIGQCLACQWSACAADHDPPLVIGFERFARHGDVNEVESGRLLLGELSCTACHAATEPELQPKSGPKLESAGRRLRAEWLTQYLNQPAAVDAGTTMPDVLAHIDATQKPRVIEALVAFLISQQAPFPELKASGANPVLHEFWNKGNAASGKQIYHQSGCVACHEPAADQAGSAKTDPALEKMLEELEPEELAKLGLAHAARTIPSIGLPNVRNKYTPPGLAMFLLDPANVRPGGRMPNMKLRSSDAADLVAWLFSTTTAKPAAARTVTNKSLQEEGRKLFASLGCANCHSAQGATAVPRGKPLRSLSAKAQRSCMAAAQAGPLPRYTLDDQQRSAITAALEALKQPANTPPAAAQSLAMSMLRLNCYACHVRDGLGGIARGRDGYFETKGQVDIGDEGRLPPPLTGVGRKLVTPHLKAVLSGTGDIRPHLQIRMPKYAAAQVDALVDQLTQADGVQSQPGSKPPSPVDATMAQAGRTLFNLGCVQCHPLKGHALPGVVGVEIGRIGQRVRREWFHDFLINPASLKPRTRMPTFFAAGSVNQQVLGGDVEKQVEALWTYLEDIDRQPLPDKIEQIRRQNFELVPRDKPIVLRTFMQLAGTHAIAVGFPGRVHYAFDAESVRLAELWGDRFLDAQGTWNDRMAPVAAPLTSNRIPLPIGPDFAILSNKNAAWPDSSSNPLIEPTPTQVRFMGYRLDKEGVPSFLYSIGAYQIVDRLVPASEERLASEPTLKAGLASGSQSPARGLIRELTITAQPGAVKGPEQLWYRAVGSGKQLKQAGNTWTYASGLSVTLPDALAKAAFSRNASGQSQVLVPIPVAPKPAAPKAADSQSVDSKVTAPKAAAQPIKFSVLYTW